MSMFGFGRRLHLDTMAQLGRSLLRSPARVQKIGSAKLGLLTHRVGTCLRCRRRHLGPMSKPYAQSCDENKAVILAAIAPLLAEARSVLEIGSGTGQHAVHFAAALPHLTWQTSDRAESLPGIRLWIAESGLTNLPPPLALDVGDDWPAGPFDGVFSANTAHIMAEPEVDRMLAGVGLALGTGGCFALYGPFRAGGRHNAQSNARFDAWLKAQDPRMGVRDRDALCRVAALHGLALVQELAMPRDNRILVWQKG
jgi:SAM-dependent methyltransferase